MTGYLFYMAKKKKLFREKLLYETEAKFNAKIKCITVLAFLLLSEFIYGYNLPPRLGSLF